MTVYIELAFLENALIDGSLLSLALCAARVKRGKLRIIFAALLGGAEAVAIPLLRLSALRLLFLKLLGGVLLVLVAVGEKRVRPYFVTAILFFGFTFTLGGLLTALSSLSAVDRTGVPVAVAVVASTAFFLAGKWGIARMFRKIKTERALYPCRLTAGGRTVEWRGFSDSGNCLFFRGEPVCVLSAAAALLLFRREKPVGRMVVSTLHGAREEPVFACPLVCGEKYHARALFTVGNLSTEEYQIVLHTAYTEGS